MSMCLYITAGPEPELMKLARDPNGLSRMSMAHAVARMSAFGAPGLGGAMPDEATFERQLKEMSRGAWRQGVLAGLFVFAMKGAMRRNFRKMRAQADAAAPAPGEPSAPPPPAPDVLDLHKSWHMLHYLFTGTAWEGAAPANTLLLGGREVGEDLGYGPARIVDARATAEFAAFLAGFTARALKSRLDMKKMKALEIYCAEDDDGASKSELMDDVDANFPLLKDYVTAAAARGNAVAIWMS
jgi:hypothetical protein